MLENIRVLIIDDNAQLLEVLTLALCGWRDVYFAVESATTLAEGLARLKLPGIDVIVLDLTLSNGSGLDVVRQVQQEAASVPMVVLTGTDDRYIEDGVIAAGAQDYLFKGSVNLIADLVSKLRHAVIRHRVRRAYQPLDDAVAVAVETLQQLRQSCQPKGV